MRNRSRSTKGQGYVYKVPVLFYSGVYFSQFKNYLKSLYLQPTP